MFSKQLIVIVQLSLIFLHAVNAEGPKDSESDGSASYQFEYSVSDPQTGDEKSQAEKRDGDVVEGVYSVLEPTGNTRTVQYKADSVNGFTAQVINSAERKSLPPTPVKTIIGAPPAPPKVQPVVNYPGYYQYPYYNNFYGAAPYYGNYYGATPYYGNYYAASPYYNSAPYNGNYYKSSFPYSQDYQNPAQSFANYQSVFGSYPFATSAVKK